MSNKRFSVDTSVDAVNFNAVQEFDAVDAAADWMRQLVTDMVLDRYLLPAVRLQDNQTGATIMTANVLEYSNSLYS
jgi:hypothetical protein